MLPLFGSGIRAGTIPTGIFPAGTFPTGLGAAIGAGAVSVDVGVSTIIEADLQTLTFLSSQKVEVLLFTLIIHLVCILVRRPSFFVVRHVSYD